MKHFQKIITYLVILTINFVFIQTDLLSQNDSLGKKDSLIIGGIYKVTLISGEVILGKIQSYNSISISVISDENVINIKQELIKSIEIPKIDYHTESSFGDLQNWDSYWSIGVTGGGMIPIEDFADTYDFSGSIGADITFHFDSLWALYLNVTNNFLSQKNTHHNYYPEKSPSYFELTIGPRYYFTQEKVNGFCEFGMGLYNFDASSSYRSEARYGINFGVGAEIQLSREVDLVIKGKYHNIFKPAFMKLLTDNYLGIYTGINYNF